MFIEEFKKMYIDEIFEKKQSMSAELSALFDKVLENDLDDSPEKMDMLIDEMYDEYHGKELTVEEKQVVLEKSILELADVILGGM